MVVAYSSNTMTGTLHKGLSSACRNCVTLLLLCGLTVVSVHTTGARQAVAKAGMSDIAVAVDLACPSCARGLVRRLSRLDHVLHVQPLEQKIVIDIEPGRAIDLSTVREVIRNAGFIPTEFRLTAIGRVVHVDDDYVLELSESFRFILRHNDRIQQILKESIGQSIKATGVVSIYSDDVDELFISEVEGRRTHQ